MKKKNKGHGDVGVKTEDPGHCEKGGRWRVRELPVEWAP